MVVDFLGNMGDLRRLRREKMKFDFINMMFPP